jgi:hypothetical protein
VGAVHRRDPVLLGVDRFGGGGRELAF